MFFFLPSLPFSSPLSSIFELFSFSPHPSHAIERPSTIQHPNPPFVSSSFFFLILSNYCYPPSQSFDSNNAMFPFFSPAVSHVFQPTNGDKTITFPSQLHLPPFATLCCYPLYILRVQHFPPKPHTFPFPIITISKTTIFRLLYHFSFHSRRYPSQHYRCPCTHLCHSRHIWPPTISVCLSVFQYMIVQYINPSHQFSFIIILNSSNH